MKVLLALAVLVSALLATLTCHFAPAHLGAGGQEPASRPVRIVRSPQAPKIVRPVHHAMKPAPSPAHPVMRPGASQHKA